MDVTGAVAVAGGIDGDEGRLDALRRTPAGDPTARRAAAKELEVVFLTQLLRAMRKTIPENDFLPRSPARSVYEGAFDHSVAAAMAATDPLGLVGILGGDPGSSSPGVQPITVAGHQTRSRSGADQ